MQVLILAALLAAPQRIISTAPSITEMLYALGLGDRVAAVTLYCHYPPEARRKPKIGSYLNPDLEAMLRARPDLIVTLESAPNVKNKLPALGAPVLALRNETVAHILESIVALGERTGAASAARERVRAIEQDLRGIEERAARLPRRGVMFVVGRTPGTVQDLVVVGGGSYLNELLERAGGRNAFADTRITYPKVSREEVLARRPEVVIDMGEMADTDQATEAQKRMAVELWKRAAPWARVYAVASDVFVVPGPRVAEAARELGKMIHPEAGW
jgi:iron complex transport system substrate-binding protein